MALRPGAPAPRRRRHRDLGSRRPVLDRGVAAAVPTTDPLVLAADLVLVPVADLPEAVRGRVGAGEGDWAVTRRRARTPSRVVDAQSAALLAEFHTPSTVAEAVLRFSRGHAA